MRYMFLYNIGHMKILMINGEAENNGIMEQAMDVITSFCKENGMTSDIVVVDQNHNQPCIACGKCYRKRRCQFPGINEILEKLETYDGIVVGGAVRYGRLNRETIHFMQRMQRCGNDRIAYVPAVVLLSMRNRNDCLDAKKTMHELLHLNQSRIVEDNGMGILSGCNGKLTQAEISHIEWLMEQMEEEMKQKRQPSDPQNPVMRLLDYVR